MMEKLRQKLATMPATPLTPKPDALAAIPTGKVVELDVRDELRAGQEPFSLIMAARQRMPAGGAFSVRAIFEPVPLYAVLARQGLTHWTEKLADDDWRVWFWEQASEAAPAPETEAAAEALDGDVIVLDVRSLEPPEPMLRTLAALEQMPAGKTLVQINVRTPQFLLPMLAERGYTWEVREQEKDLVRVFIRKAETETTRNEGNTMRTLDVRVIPPREKHPTIFQTFGALQPGESFVLVNDHDPKPLRYQFEYEHAGQFGWEYLEQGPAVWRVQISRTGA